MNGFSDYDLYDAVGLAELVRKREVSAAELLAEACVRCDRVNGKLNAVVHRLDAKAQQARGSDRDGPFAGVPFLIKDIGPALAGAPLTSGSRLFVNCIPSQDGEIVKRFKAAGLIPFGKTNVPEFGLVPYTEPALFGPCRNPWDLGRTPGGSSGGAAAAVAAGIVPMAHASDGGGSIRIPASCCGLVGLKPSRGLNPLDAGLETMTTAFVMDHVVSRSVRDCAATLDAVCNRPNAGFLAGLEREPRALRVAVIRSAMFGSSVAPDVRAALQSAVRLMEAIGHTVEDAEPAVDYADLSVAYLFCVADSTHKFAASALQVLGRPPLRRDLELATWTLARVGGALSAEDRARAKAVIERATRAYLAFSQKFDIVMSPVLGSLPLRIGELHPNAWEALAMRVVERLNAPRLMKPLLKAMAAKNFAFAPFTAQFNMTGQPAISLPLGWSAQGLPIGIQFAAGPNADDLLLRLARQLERAQPWAHRRPAVRS